jgi:hypothetical protein
MGGHATQQITKARWLRCYTPLQELNTEHQIIKNIQYTGEVTPIYVTIWVELQTSACMEEGDGLEKKIEG